MSNRSALVSPSTESGNIGYIVSVDAVISPTLVTNGFYTTASLQVPAGLWSITMGTKLEYTLGTIVEYSNAYLQTSTLLGVTTNWLINEYYNVTPVAEPATIYQERTNTITLRLTEQSIINVIVQVGFTAGTGVFSNPLDGASGAIWAVKLA